MRVADDGAAPRLYQTSILEVSNQSKLNDKYMWGVGSIQSKLNNYVWGGGSIQSKLNDNNVWGGVGI